MLWHVMPGFGINFNSKKARKTKKLSIHTHKNIKLHFFTHTFHRRKDAQGKPCVHDFVLKIPWFDIIVD
jgi:hypothetical protein